LGGPNSPQGNGFLHAYLKAFFPMYRDDKSIESRVDIVKRLSDEIAAELTKENPAYTGLDSLYSEFSQKVGANNVRETESLTGLSRILSSESKFNYYQSAGMFTVVRKLLELYNTGVPSASKTKDISSILSVDELKGQIVRGSIDDAYIAMIAEICGTNFAILNKDDNGNIGIKTESLFYNVLTKSNFGDKLVFLLEKQPGIYDVVGVKNFDGTIKTVFNIRDDNNRFVNTVYSTNPLEGGRTLQGARYEFQNLPAVLKSIILAPSGRRAVRVEKSAKDIQNTEFIAIVPFVVTANNVQQFRLSNDKKALVVDSN
jgi:hypothetical protein